MGAEVQANVKCNHISDTLDRSPMGYNIDQSMIDRINSQEQTLQRIATQ